MIHLPRFVSYNRLPDYNIYMLHKFFSVLTVVLLCVVFLIQGIIQINHNTNPNDMDTHLYLADSIHIKDNGGIFNFLNFCMSGNYREADRHPVYLLYLSVLASRGLSFFPIAKLMTLLTGLVLVISVYLIAQKHFGEITGIIAVLLLIFNKQIVYLSSMVVSTIPYSIFVILSWHYITSGFKHNRLWITAGIFVGLAYMTKGSGLFVIFAFIITLFVVYKWRFVLNRFVWTFVICFLFISSPLIVRNIKVYHSPFYNYNSKLLWFDEFEMIMNPEYYQRTHTLLTYIKTHTVKQIWNRLIQGMIRDGNLWIKTMTPRSLNLNLAGLGILIIALWGIASDPERTRSIFSLGLILIFYIFFAWWFKSQPRYFIVVFPILYIYAGYRITSLIPEIFKISPITAFRYNWIFLFSVTTFLVVTSILLLSLNPISNPLYSVKLSPGFLKLADWFERNVLIDEIYILGPTHSYVFWYLPHYTDRTNLREFPYYQSIEKVIEYVIKENITYIVLDREVYHRRVEVLAHFISDTPEKGLEIIRPIPGWVPVFQDPSSTTNYIVFKTLKM